MLHHIVLLAPNGEGGLTQIKQAMAILEMLPARITGMGALHHGPNRDFEGKSPRYTYGFSITFTDHAAYQAYVDDPQHMRAGDMLVQACFGGHDGIFVADLEA